MRTIGALAGTIRALPFRRYATQPEIQDTDGPSVKTKPTTRFVLSACVAGLLLLGVGAILIAAAIGPSLKGYLPGLVILIGWADYVRRPKNVAELRWNWLYLLLLAMGTIGVAFLTNPNQIQTVLLYWVMAIMMTVGAPLLLGLAVVVFHQWVCASEARAAVQLEID